VASLITACHAGDGDSDAAVRPVGWKRPDRVRPGAALAARSPGPGRRRRRRRYEWRRRVGGQPGPPVTRIRTPLRVGFDLAREPVGPSQVTRMLLHGPLHPSAASESSAAWSQCSRAERAALLPCCCMGVGDSDAAAWSSAIANVASFRGASRDSETRTAVSASANLNLRLHGRSSLRVGRRNRSRCQQCQQDFPDSEGTGSPDCGRPHSTARALPSLPGGRVRGAVRARGARRKRRKWRKRALWTESLVAIGGKLESESESGAVEAAGSGGSRCQSDSDAVGQAGGEPVTRMLSVRRVAW
jgi:hypothetical protein